MLADTRRTHHARLTATAFDAGGKTDRFQDPFLPKGACCGASSAVSAKSSASQSQHMDQLVGRQLPPAAAPCDAMHAVHRSQVASGS